MKAALMLTSKNDNRIDPRSALTLAWALLAAIGELLRMTRHLNSYELLPTIASSRVALVGAIDVTRSAFDPMESLMSGVDEAAALLNAGEHLLATSLCDRLLLPDARLPIPVIQKPGLPELLVYDQKKDQIQCRIGHWSELVDTNLKILKVLSGISSAGLAATLELDGSPVSFPEVSPSIFSHGYGQGHSVVSTCCVSGIYLVAQEIEARIDGFRDNRVFRAHLGEAARLAAIRFRPPYTAAVQFSEAVPHLPLMPAAASKVVVEKMWDFEEQPEFAFT